MTGSKRVAWLALTIAIGACGGSDSGGPLLFIPVGSVLVQPDSMEVEVPRNAIYSATVRDQAGALLTGRVVTWSTSDTRLALVSSAGVVTALAPGRVNITATSEGKSDAAVLFIKPIDQPPNDYAIDEAQFTQGVQSADGSIPVVLNGNHAVLNVLVRAARPTDSRVPVVLRRFSSAGALLGSDTVLTDGPLAAAPRLDRPSAQFLIPASALRSDLRWQVELDPRQVLADDSAANDVWPRVGQASLATVTVPALKVRFVQIILAAHGNRTPIMNDGLIPEYVRTLRSVHPLGVIDATIGTPLSTNASFGVAPRGGESSFWTQVLSEIELARVTSPTGDAQTHWFGLVNPPVGFNFTTFGGFGLIGQGQNNARSALAVNIGWFTNQAQSRELFAHELGHNFGRRHAPCNSPSGVDPLFPQADGAIGRFGHDVFAWASGRATKAETVSSLTGDIMGYCSPVWSSEYTYRGVLSARGTLTAVARPLPVLRTRVLIVRGTIDSQRGVMLQPAFVMVGRPTQHDQHGSHTLQGRAADGRLLFRQRFDPVDFDHAPGLRSFTIALPVNAEVETNLHAIEVRGPGLRAVGITRADTGITSTTNARAQPTDTGVRANCPAGTRGIAVMDTQTGAMLGSASGASLHLPRLAQTRVTVSCSDGVRTTTITQ